MSIVTGWGAVSSLGQGAAALWRGLADGADGIGPIRRFSTQGFGVRIAALVPSTNDEESGHVAAFELSLRYALEATREAWHDALLDRAAVPAERIALVVGASPGGDIERVCELTEHLGDAFGARGPRLTVSTACTSSTNAIGLAKDLLDAGAADVVFAGGAEVLTPVLFAGFHALGVLSADKCAPFSERYGTTLGEGAGFLVMERASSAEARGARVRAVLSGYGLSGDAFHETGPDPTGSGVARAIRAALRHAGAPSEEIGYVNAHGTGTRANDPAEWRALEAVFGARAKDIPTSSTKSVLGHAQAAAGVLETLATLLCMEKRVLPQTLHVETLRAKCPPDPVAQATPRPGTFRRAVCTNSAFGGANAALVLSSPSESACPQRVRRTVYVAGVGLTAPESSLPASPGVDLAPLDPTTRYLTSAAAAALDDAGVGRMKGALRDRAGIVCGINRVSPASIHELRQSIIERGLPLLSANAFSRMVLNAPAGATSKHLALRGPLSTISIGPGSGLAAIVYAATLMAERDDVDLMVAGGVDEAERPDAATGSAVLDGAAVVALTTATPSAHSVRLAGWAIAGPEEGETAITRALASARRDRAEVDAVFASGAEFGEAAGSAADVVRATRAVRAKGGVYVVVAQGSRSASCAAVFDTGAS